LQRSRSESEQILPTSVSRAVVWMYLTGEREALAWCADACDGGMSASAQALRRERKNCVVVAGGCGTTTATLGENPHGTTAATAVGRGWNAKQTVRCRRRH
jgi:hypothetical protein